MVEFVKGTLSIGGLDFSEVAHPIAVPAARAIGISSVIGEIVSGGTAFALK